jgi:LemA protein
MGGLRKMGDSVVSWLVLALLLFWAMGAYNRLMRCRSQGIGSFAVLEDCLDHYVLLVKTNAPGPQAQEAVQVSWAGLAAAAEQFKASLRFARTQPLHGPAMNALRTAHGTLCESWTRVRELPVELLDAAWLQALQAEWERVSVKTEMARHEFNRSVAIYNEAIGQFPALLLAWLFGFKPAQTL